MAEHLVFLTGHLACARLERVLAGMDDTPFTYNVVDIGVKVAALMTEEIIKRRLKRPVVADRIILPGRYRGEVERLSAEFGAPFVRGPDEVADLPAYLGRSGQPVDLTRHDMRIFAEIVDAPSLPLDVLLQRARILSAAGADVIDLGCLPDTKFLHLPEAVRLLKADGLKVSIDSAKPDELELAARSGADYLLSLDEHSVGLAARYGATPILIPAVAGDLDSLDRAIHAALRAGIRFIVDPVLDPIHFGFAASLGRFIEVRRRWPDIEMMMGTGNLTELTDADSSGVTALLAGLCSELRIGNVLVVNVSPHTSRTVQEHDRARRVMFAARQDQALPRGYDAGLLQVHDHRPFAHTMADIETLAGSVRDAGYRIMTAPDGVHIFNASGHHIAQDAFDLFPALGVESDGSHAFYLGAELTRAEIAWRLGKRYVQDQALDWGVAVPEKTEDRKRLADAGHTMRASRKKGDAG